MNRRLTTNCRRTGIAAGHVRMENISEVIQGFVFVIVYWTLPCCLNVDYSLDIPIRCGQKVMIEGEFSAVLGNENHKKCCRTHRK